MQREHCGCFLGSMQRHDHSPETGLDEADHKRLAAALAGAREARVYRRLEALLLVAEGHSVAEAARRCRVDRSSVHRWLVQYRAEHEATALCDRPRSGRPRRHPRLTPQRLAAALARDPRRCGYQAKSWTVPLLAHDPVSRPNIPMSFPVQPEACKSGALPLGRIHRPL